MFRSLATCFCPVQWVFIAVVGVLGITTMLASCGQRGPLEPPPAAERAVNSEITGKIEQSAADAEPRAIADDLPALDAPIFGASGTDPR
ncbi:MAG: LPS translocon maturation chaperone LptM [Thioalkalivibrionaceae bacterium]